LIVDHVGQGEKAYHKYDMIVYPKKTQVSKSVLKKLSTKFKGGAKTSGSNEEEEFVPMSISEMSVFCLQSYLNKYKVIVCEGNFQQGSNVIQLVDNIMNVFNSLASFSIRVPTLLYWRTVAVEVSDMNGYREVCNNNCSIIHILLR
jgi:hypothetical protein